MSDVKTTIAPIERIAKRAARVKFARGRTLLRCYHETAQLTHAARPEVLAAVSDLAKLGVQVKVYEGSVVHTVSCGADGVPVWIARATPRTRDYVVVEVAL